MISVSSVSKSFKKRKLFSDLSFTIGKGITFISGESGGGKSTLLKIILKRIKPDSGCVVYDEKYSISYLPQTEVLIPNLTVKENISYLKSLSKYPFQDDRFESLIRILKVASLADNRYSELSDGEKRVFSFCVCCSISADVYAFDEPLASVDKARSLLLLSAMQELSKESAVIIVSHERAEDFPSGTTFIHLDESKPTIVCQGAAALQHIDCPPVSRERCKAGIKLRVNAGIIFSSVASVLLLFASTLFIFLTCATAKRGTDNFDEFEVQNNPSDLYQIRLEYGGDSIRAFTPDTFFDVMPLITQNDSCMIYVPFIPDINIADEQTVREYDSLSPFFILDPALSDDTIYYFTGDEPEIDISKYTNPYGAKLKVDDMSFDEPDSYFNRKSAYPLYHIDITLEEQDRFYLSKNMFVRMLKGGLYKGLYRTSGQPLSSNDGIALMNVLIKYIQHYKPDTVEREFIYETFNISIIDGERKVGVSGFDAGEKFTSYYRFNGQHISYSYLTTADYPTEETNHIYLSLDMYLDFLLKTSDLFFFSSKDQSALNRSLGFYYSGPMDEYWFLEYNSIVSVFRVVFMVLSPVFLLSALTVLLVYNLKNSKSKFLNSLEGIPKNRRYFSPLITSATVLIPFVAIACTPSIVNTLTANCFMFLYNLIVNGWGYVHFNPNIPHFFLLYPYPFLFALLALMLFIFALFLAYGLANRRLRRRL